MIQTFIQYLKTNRGLSENTTRSYENDLRDFASFARDRWPNSRWSQIQKWQIDAYVSYMVNEEYEPATIKRHIAALRTYYKTIMALGMMNDNPARYVSTPKLRTQLPKTIEKEAITKSLEDPNTDPQAKAAIAIIYETGIRLQELIDLQASSINPSNSSITIEGKGKKQRTVYYGTLTRQYGRKWKAGTHTQREVRHLVYQALKRYSKAPQLSPHALRHTFASEMLNNGASITEISKLLGHEHIETTEVYAHLSNSQTQQRYLTFAPTL